MVTWNAFLFGGTAARSENSAGSRQRRPKNQPWTFRGITKGGGTGSAGRLISLKLRIMFRLFGRACEIGSQASRPSLGPSISTEQAKLAMHRTCVADVARSRPNLTSATLARHLSSGPPQLWKRTGPFQSKFVLWHLWVSAILSCQEDEGMRGA